MDNYKVAVETADKCCQANAQFAEISEVCNHATRSGKATGPAFDVVQLPPGTSDDRAVFSSPQSVKSHAALYSGADCFNCAVGQLL